MVSYGLLGIAVVEKGLGDGPVSRGAVISRDGGEWCAH